jgi:endoglucanase
VHPADVHHGTRQPAEAGCLPRVWLILALAALFLPMLGAPSARAAVDPLGFQIQVPAAGLVVHEQAGQALITVARDSRESSLAGQVRYVTSGNGYDPETDAPFQCGAEACTATSYDFTSAKGELDFAPGETSKTFSVAIVDHHQVTVPTTLQVALFGAAPAPIGLGPAASSTLTILNDDPPDPRVSTNPLGLAIDPNASDPLAGADFFVDRDSPAAGAARRLPALRTIADEPGTARFGTFSFASPYVADIGTAVSRYLARAAAQEPGAVPLLATYRITQGACARHHPSGDSPDQQQSYHDFIARFAQGIGSYRAVLFLEEDGLITTPCLNAEGVTTRMNELNDAIDVLTSTCPHLVVYLDAGAADALPARRSATLLERAGVAKIQGFFLNSTHFDRTSKEARYGEQISRLTGGRHFVINTGENGRGPLRPRNVVRQGNEVLCNPPGRGLGPKPTTRTRYPNVDMFAWTSNPGESGGTCVAGAPPTGAYWSRYALMLVRNAKFRVT